MSEQKMPTLPNPAASSDAAGKLPDLKTPDHSVEEKQDDVKPKVNVGAAQPSNSLNAKKASAKGIEVVALRPGFYNQERKREGDKFFIKNQELLGLS